MHLGEYVGALCDVLWYVMSWLEGGGGFADCKGIATLYWAHIGRVIYAATNEQLATLTGPGNKENFTMKWHTRDILLDQQKDVEIIGPVEGMDKIVVEESDIYWSTTRK